MASTAILANTIVRNVFPLRPALAIHMAPATAQTRPNERKFKKVPIAPKAKSPIIEKIVGNRRAAKYRMKMVAVYAIPNFHNASKLPRVFEDPTAIV